MNKFFRDNKNIIFFCSVAIGLLALIFALAEKLPLSILTMRKENYLAQIIAIEINALKAWQQSKGLKNTLTYNSVGQDVVLLQKMLSQSPSIYPDRKITGYYGNLTRKAIVRFQKEYNLPQTGSVDIATKNKLNEIFLTKLCPEQTTIYPEFLLKKVTKQHPLPKDYVPPSLEDVSEKIKTIGTVCVRKDIVPYLTRMFNDAQKDGVNLVVTSGYRKPEIQQYLYDLWFSIMGPSAYYEIAEPGKSEHQLGTTVDLTDSSIGYARVDDRFSKSRGGRWLAQNAHKYGFTMSYPKGKEKVTGYKYEPWHWRFVGIDIATSLFNQGLAFSESNFDMRQKPYPRRDIKNGLVLSSDAVYSIFVDRNGVEHVLIEKNKETRLPIANITKLMVALVASDVFKTTDKVVVSENALRVKGASGVYIAGNTFYFNDAMNALLLGMHNEIAVAMAEHVGVDEFIRRMNEKAKSLGLHDTRYFNVIGFDHDTGSEEINYSTAFDIYKLLRYIFENRADIFSVLQKNEHQLTDVSKVTKIAIENTNKLLANQNIALRVLGGKTDDTPYSKLHLAIVSAVPSRGRIVSVVIGSDDNFQDMEELLKFIKNSFVW